MVNKNLSKIINEIANENSIQIYSYEDDWFFELEKNGKRTFVYGFVFEDNPAAVNYILKDKSALFEILKKHDIDAVEHFYFYNQKNEDHFKQTQLKLNEFLKKYGSIVLKNNTGTGGVDVFKISSEKDLEEKQELLKNKYNCFSLSPFYDIKHEYRAIIQDSKIQILYEKIRPFVVGNGQDSIETLINKKYQNKISISSDINKNQIPKQGENVVLNWKHNLGQGAIPKNVKNQQIFNDINNIVQKILNIMEINFASIDIVYTNGTYKVLEINGGVMMEKFAEYSKENYNLAKKLYESAILKKLK